jgi:hypothetical protein
MNGENGDLKSLVFYEGEETEAAIIKMGKALEKGNTAAALKLARKIVEYYEISGAIVDRPGYDAKKEKRLSVLRTYFELRTIQIRLNREIEFICSRASKAHDEYNEMGGDWFELEAYRTGKSLEQIHEERRKADEEYKARKAAANSQA